MFSLDRRELGRPEEEVMKTLTPHRGLPCPPKNDFTNMVLSKLKELGVWEAFGHPNCPRFTLFLAPVSRKVPLV